MWPAPRRPPVQPQEPVPSADVQGNDDQPFVVHRFATSIAVGRIVPLACTQASRLYGDFIRASFYAPVLNQTKKELLWSVEMKFPPTITGSIHLGRAGDRAGAHGREPRPPWLRWLGTPRNALGLSALAAGVTAGPPLPPSNAGCPPRPAPPASLALGAR